MATAGLTKAIAPQPKENVYYGAGLDYWTKKTRDNFVMTNKKEA